MEFYRYIHNEKLSTTLEGLKLTLEKENQSNVDEISWLDKEIEGYTLDDEYPDYRIMQQDLKFDIQTPTNIQHGLDRDWEYLLKDLKVDLSEDEYNKILERLKNNKIDLSIFDIENLLMTYKEGPVFLLSNEWLMELNRILQKDHDFEIQLLRIYTSLKISDFKLIHQKTKNKAIKIYKEKIENTHLQKLAEEIFMSNGNNNQTNIGSIVNNGSNSIISGNTVNYAINNSKEDDFIETLKELISQDKEQPQMVKNLAINELNNIKEIKNEEERINRWNNFRAMVADWTTIMTPLVPFLTSLGIS